MTRKDFELIAGVLATERDAYDRRDGVALAALDLIARRFARTLADTNPAFDRDRFLKAAGVWT